MPTESQNPEQTVQHFISRWEKSGAAERANCQIFLTELCSLIGVPPPDPATPDTNLNAYVFERAVNFDHGDGAVGTGRIDLYKRGCFVLEAKQGSDPLAAGKPLSSTVREAQARLKKGTARRGTAAWDDAMLRARGQAEQYIRALPAEEGRPPFLVVVDVGHSIELYSEFSCTGGAYIPFPSPGAHRIFLRDLERADLRERLRGIWTEPLSLDPSKRSARVTREIAGHLARLAVSLEADGHSAGRVAAFLMRCLFTMFAEDVGLLMRNSFTNLLESLRDTPDHFIPMVEELWQKMNSGGFSTTLRTNILQFNGGLFSDGEALPLTRDQLCLLIEAAKADWRDVEPAIFGTLLERALDPVERHKLGAHYTPRAYVERLVLHTVINPVRADWDAVRIAAVNLANQGDLKSAVSEVRKFHRALCHIRVLDPACGSGNFLYVVLEHLKRIEGEILDALDGFGERQSLLDMAGETVDPHQLLGLEINPRAAAIAELVLWIGTLQWHFRNRGSIYPRQPIIRNFHNIECRDALIEYDSKEEVLDDNGQPVTHWDGRTTKPHPVTGKEVPDETVRIPVYHYSNPRKAEWPQADYIIGNPPFIGARRIRMALGDKYLEAVRGQYSDVPENCDFVLYWWHIAAEKARSNSIKRFGFITTNSITQSFARKLLTQHMQAKNRLSLIFAISDHPWIQSEDGAAVRIAMTTGMGGTHKGELHTVVSEKHTEGDSPEIETAVRFGTIAPDLSVGTDIAYAKELKANEGMSCVGYQLSGKGFIVDDPENVPQIERSVLHDLLTARDVTDSRPLRRVVDFCGKTQAEIQREFPYLYQWILDRVLPERKTNNRKSVRENWWLYGELRSTFRPAIASLDKLIATPLTSKHRMFIFCDPNTVCDSTTVMFAFDDAFHLGVLSSRFHVYWALASGGTLEDRPRYNKTRCFETFPFPEATDQSKERIRSLGEQLDAHRKARQAQYPELTMTGMYNVLEKLRSGEALTAKEKIIHEQGLVSVLKQLHDELDAAVAEVYGWPVNLSDEEILERLVALNSARAAEEARGQIHWLRPDFQAPGEVQGELNVDATPSSRSARSDSASKRDEGVASTIKQPWPKTLPDQVRLLRAALAAQPAPVTAEELARSFTRAQTNRVADLLETLVTLGQARKLDGVRYTVG